MGRQLFHVPRSMSLITGLSLASVAASLPPQIYTIYLAAADTAEDPPHGSSSSISMRLPASCLLPSALTPAPPAHRRTHTKTHIHAQTHTHAREACAQTHTDTLTSFLLPVPVHSDCKPRKAQTSLEGGRISHI